MGKNGPMCTQRLKCYARPRKDAATQQGNPFHEVYTSTPSGVKSSGNVVAEVG